MADAIDETALSEKVGAVIIGIIVAVGYFIGVSAVLLLFLPDPPITPTEECSEDRARRCLSSMGSCDNLEAGRSYPLRYETVRKCRERADPICAPCDDWRQRAYDRTYLGKLTHYLALLKEILSASLQKIKIRYLAVIQEIKTLGMDMLSVCKSLLSKVVPIGVVFDLVIGALVIGSLYLVGELTYYLTPYLVPLKKIFSAPFRKIKTLGMVVLIVCKFLLMWAAPMGIVFGLGIGILFLINLTVLWGEMLLDGLLAPFGLGPGILVEWLGWWEDRSQGIDGLLGVLVRFCAPIVIPSVICYAAYLLWATGMALYEGRKESRHKVSLCNAVTRSNNKARRRLWNQVSGICLLVGTAGGGLIGYGLDAYFGLEDVLLGVLIQAGYYLGLLTGIVFFPPEEA